MEQEGDLQYSAATPPPMQWQPKLLNLMFLLTIPQIKLRLAFYQLQQYTRSLQKPFFSKLALTPSPSPPQNKNTNILKTKLFQQNTNNSLSKLLPILV